MGSQRVGHDWSDLACTRTSRIFRKAKLKMPLWSSWRDQEAERCVCHLIPRYISEVSSWSLASCARPYKQRPHPIHKALCLLPWQMQSWQLEETQLSTANLRQKICKHVCKHDMTPSERDFQNFWPKLVQRRTDGWEGLCQIFLATCTWEPYMFWWSGR